MSEEEIFKMLLVESIDKFPLLNELFAIRDSRGKRNDYTIFVNGYISLDVINKTIKKVNLLNNLKEIEKSHKEENGKLRVELEQMKQKVEEYRIGWCNTGEELEQEKEKNKHLEQIENKLMPLAECSYWDYEEHTCTHTCGGCEELSSENRRCTSGILIDEDRYCRLYEDGYAEKDTKYVNVSDLIKRHCQ